MDYVKGGCEIGLMVAVDFTVRMLVASRTLRVCRSVWCGACVCMRVCLWHGLCVYWIVCLHGK